jgi:F-type H+-transporting ATPase subunit epsilon
MAETEFGLNVVTPDGPVWEGRAVSVVIPGLDGYFGVWHGHMPLIAGLDIGTVMIKTPGDRNIIYIATGGGFVEVNRESVSILAETAEAAERIDLVRAGAAEQRAREELSQFFSSVSREPAENALRRALNRKHTVERARAHPTELF